MSESVSQSVSQSVGWLSTLLICVTLWV